MTYQCNFFQPSMLPGLLQSILRGDASRVEHILRTQPQLTLNQQKKQQAYLTTIYTLINILNSYPELSIQVLLLMLIQQEYNQRFALENNTHFSSEHHAAEKILRPLQLPQYVIGMIVNNPAILALIVCTPTPTGISDQRAEVLSILQRHSQSNLEREAVQLPRELTPNIENGLRALDVLQQPAMAC